MALEPCAAGHIFCTAYCCWDICLLFAVADETQVAPAGTPLRVRLMSLFCKSVAAANIFPGALEVRVTPASRHGLHL